MEKISKFQMAALVSLLVAQSACLDEDQAPATELMRPDAPVQVQQPVHPEGVQQGEGAQDQVEQAPAQEGDKPQQPADQEAGQGEESPEQAEAPADQENNEAGQEEQGQDHAGEEQEDKPVAKPMHPFEKNRPDVKDPAGGGTGGGAGAGPVEAGENQGGSTGGSEDHSETCETD